MWYRRRRGIWGFPFMLFFVLLFISHSWSLFLIGIVLSIILSLFVRSLMAGTFGARRPNTPPTWQQPYQQPQQPYQQYYQPYQQPYQSYDQGYQPPAAPYEEPRPQYQNQQTQYEEQPQAQYPQELPPMEQ
jgi:hypothetical protein